MASGKLESLWNEIQNRRLKNWENADFIPSGWLSDLLTEPRILDILEEGTIDKDERPEIARVVRKAGLKTFAIFVTMRKPDLVYRVFQTDQYNDQNDLDKRLPMDDVKLESVLGLTTIKKDIESLLQGRCGKDTQLDGDSEFQRLKQREAECIRLCKEFDSIQYMFQSPTFPQGPLHRLLEDYTRLPFLQPPEQQGLADAVAATPASGAFGKVIKAMLPPARYDDKQGIRVVRKELKTQGERGEGAFTSELRCLRLLAATRHPSLLQLYGSYTYRRTHNFLFREAVDGDLHDLLDGKTRPPEFECDETFYLAFCSLASALEQVHCYTNDDLKLKMIGCHHDLKPRNVLVDAGNFILADFGLATMREDGLDPLVLAQDRDQYFAAPENIDYVQLSRGRVGPPGDIWSLGCILTEVFTYMRGGRGAVQKFRGKRHSQENFGDCVIENKAFHNLRGKINPVVKDHLDEMEAAARPEGTAKTADVCLIRLVRDMLTIAPSSRPDIKIVLQHLRSIALQKIAEPVYQALQDSPHSENLEFIIERQIFFGWLSRLDEAAQKSLLYLPTDAAFTQAHETLRALLQEIQLLAENGDEYPLFAQLRRLNEQLLSCLDVAGRLSIRRTVEINAIPVARKLARKSGLSAASVSEAALEASGPNASVLRLLAVDQVRRRMAESGTSGASAVPKLERSDITLFDLPSPQDTATETTFRLGRLKRERGRGGGAGVDNDTEIPVVVEEMTVGPKYSKPENSDRLFKRLENILSLGGGRRDADTLPVFRALNCCGIYFDPGSEVIGLTYRYPFPSADSGSGSSRSSSAKTPRVLSLAQLLEEQRYTVDYDRHVVVGLDDRVRLARDLATAVFKFHQIGWLHKNISSHNVLFFHHDGDDGGNTAGIDTGIIPPEPTTTATKTTTAPPRRLDLSAPALIGFSHSRAADAGKLSSKRYHTASALRAYHHPLYAGGGGIGGRGDREEYRAEFDYYSLGLVLLEIGHWWSLRKICGGRGPGQDDRARMREHILARSLPFLTGAVGEAYARATEACLSGVLGKTKEEGGGHGAAGGPLSSVEEDFSRLVIAPLEELVRRIPASPG